MPVTTPRLPLVLLLLTAACIFVGGVQLSRREGEVRIPQNRPPLNRFATDLMRELRRLEELHFAHLDRLSRTASPQDPVRTQRDCEAIVGVVECSFLFHGSGGYEHYVRASHIRYGMYPRPTFESPSLNRADFAVLDPERFLKKSASASGWLDEPGKPLFFWRQRLDTLLVLLTIEPADVQAATTGWIETWLQDHPPPTDTAGAEIALMAPDGRPLLRSETARSGQDQAHWSQPLPTRYGAWNLMSWDKTERRVIHHAPTLTIAASLSVLVALLSGFVFVQQKRAHTLATQRVSFVNRVSHELRTPLTNMLLNLDLVEESLPQGSQESVNRLSLVREETGRLARLIENVLTFSRHEQGRLKVYATPCHPRYVIDGILAQFAQAFARRGITVSREHEGHDSPCLLDADALAQIAANLFSNVEKYAPDAPVTVRTEQGDDTFTLTVSDEGPGVSTIDRDRIFEPFARMDDRVNAGATGTGLGLSIARDLGERMGGTLRLHDSEKGACFVLEIPFIAPQPRG